MTVPQAAEYLSRSEYSVRHMVAAGKLPAVRLDGRVFLDTKDIDRVIDEAKAA